MALVPESVVVDVKSAWLSTINWTQAVGVLASILVVFGIEMDANTQVAVVASINGVMALVTWALKTFSKPSATPSQAKKA